MSFKVKGITYNGPSVSANYGTVSVGTTETILNSVIVPSNTFAVYDVIGVQTRVIKVSGTSAVDIRLRIGTGLTTSSTQIGIFNSGATANNFIPFERRMTVESAASTTVVYTSGSSSAGDHAAVLQTNMTSVSINWTTNNYIIITGQSTSGGARPSVLNCGYIYTDLCGQLPNSA